MSHRIDSTGAVVVDTEYHWLPIDEKTPRLAKVQVINKDFKIASDAVLPVGAVHYWTHWAPYPTFKDE